MAQPLGQLGVFLTCHFDCTKRLVFGRLYVDYGGCVVVLKVLTFDGFLTTSKPLRTPPGNMATMRQCGRAWTTERQCDRATVWYQNGCNAQANATEPPMNMLVNLV